MSVSPNGFYIATGGSDGIVQVNSIQGASASIQLNGAILSVQWRGGSNRFLRVRVSTRRILILRINSSCTEISFVRALRVLRFNHEDYQDPARSSAWRNDEMSRLMEILDRDFHELLHLHNPRSRRSRTQLFSGRRATVLQQRGRDDSLARLLESLSIAED
ncbi:hypothetical protein NLJ89_g7182 [Agrocybe chaxingu]|uniref:Uncharacterized protein n=1 Tax=Agrocybe chaxingu TaxID=84603 RepID=A0A9W8JX61_9AGAR|nr:hypothetical protein NLJ89_g7182 [Agrocybe chaxingu]